MGRRKWVYTDGGKPLPDGPREVEVGPRPPDSLRSDDGATSQQPSSTAGAADHQWVDYQPPEDDR